MKPQYHRSVEPEWHSPSLFIGPETPLFLTTSGNPTTVLLDALSPSRTSPMKRPSLASYSDPVLLSPTRPAPVAGPASRRQLSLRARAVVQGSRPSTAQRTIVYSPNTLTGTIEGIDRLPTSPTPSYCRSPSSQCLGSSQCLPHSPALHSRTHSAKLAPSATLVATCSTPVTPPSLPPPPTSQTRQAEQEQGQEQGHGHGHVSPFSNLAPSQLREFAEQRRRLKLCPVPGCSAKPRSIRLEWCAESFCRAHEHLVSDLLQRLKHAAN